LAILTRKFDTKSLEENEVYSTGLMEKIVYATNTNLTQPEKDKIKDSLDITVRPIAPEIEDPFNMIISDLKREVLPKTGKVPNYISIECGPTVTGPLYS
jgi:hypothetical protein